MVSFLFGYHRFANGNKYQRTLMTCLMIINNINKIRIISTRKY